jgi:hypothetical protein
VGQIPNQAVTATRPGHTDWADLMLALHRFIYQPNQQEGAQ